MKYLQPEKEIERNILTYLTYLPKAFFWKNNTTGIWDEQKQIYRKSRNKFAINGVADILGVYNGYFIAIEVKSPTGRQSEAQKLFELNFTAAGGRYLLARSVNDVIRFFKSMEVTDNVQDSRARIIH